MPASKENLIPYSCFGYYDQSFRECSKKCKHAQSCKNATESPQRQDVRKIFKYTKKHIQDLVQKWKK